jgi:integral membrane protein (TIGR00529 family)
MIDILKVSLVFIVLLIFLRFKWNVGYVLIIASALLSILYQMPLPVIVSTIKSTVTDPMTAQLFFALTLIRVLEMVLREKQVLAKMTEASRSLLRRKKAVIISMPLLIGLLPSLGGAYFSAPMVEEATRGLDMSPEEKGFINYWFRHPWEYVLPLYPGILLAAAVSGIEIRSLILANATYAFLIFATGFLFSMRNVQGIRSPKELHMKSAVASVESETHGGTGFRVSGLISFLHLVLVLLFVILFHIQLHYSLGITIIGLLVFYRFGREEIFRALKHGFALEIIVLIFGAMIFKFSMENSGAVVRLSRYFTEKGIPLLPVMFALPFVSGLLTGLTVGFVGSTFPLLISLAGGAHVNQIAFAFVSGYTGVLLSPVHLCLVLTREYFKADVWGMYKRMLPACGIILVAALAGYFVL